MARGLKPSIRNLENRGRYRCCIGGRKFLLKGPEESPKRATWCGGHWATWIWNTNPKLISALGLNRDQVPERIDYSPAVDLRNLLQLLPLMPRHRAPQGVATVRGITSLPLDSRIT